jgi:hypothetical protein
MTATWSTRYEPTHLRSSKSGDGITVELTGRGNNHVARPVVDEKLAHSSSGSMTCYGAAPTTQVSSATSLALKAKPFKPRCNEYSYLLFCGGITVELTRRREFIQASPDQS